MKTIIKILIGLIFTNLLACNNSPNTLPNKKSNAEINNEKNLISGIKTIDYKIIIDTNIILKNRNLLPLICDLERAHLTQKNKVSEIPSFIKQFLDSTTTDNFSIANPGENWQETDLISEKLQARQLIYLGVGKNITLLNYYSGGIGKSEHILIFKYQENRLIDFWSGNIIKYIKNKNETIKYLKENKEKNFGLNTNIILL